MKAHRTPRAWEVDHSTRAKVVVLMSRFREFVLSHQAGAAAAGLALTVIWSWVK